MDCGGHHPKNNNMSDLLKGKRGIIFGALDERSIAWKVAEECVKQGAKITLTNAPVALRFGQLDILGKQLEAEIIPADATNLDDLEKLISRSMEILGGKIDFVLHSIGMSVNIRKNRPYTNLNYDWMQKTYDVSAVSFHKLMQVLYKLDAMSEWGSILGLTYIAAQRVFPNYSEMAESKSLLESYARSFGYHYGLSKKVRVNTISQSPTATTAGSSVEGFNKFYTYSEKMSPLGNATSDACAEYCAVMFSDMTRYVTMQNLYHDGGFSSMGLSQAIFDVICEEEDI